MDPVGFKKGHPTWEHYVNAKGSLDTSSKWLLSFSLKSDFKTTLCFICVAAESAESLLSQLLSKSFTARSGWERAAQINFWKVHCPALLCGKPEHHFFGQQNFFPPRGSNCPPSVSAGGNLVAQKWLEMTATPATAHNRNFWELDIFSEFCTLTHPLGFAKDIKWIVWSMQWLPDMGIAKPNKTLSYREAQRLQDPWQWSWEVTS